MRIRLLLSTLGLLLSQATGIHAGSVINTNLPAGTSIVNVNAQQDGAGSYNGGASGQALWHSPFSSQGASNLLTLPVAAGTYTFSIISPADAVGQFPALTTAQRDSMFTAWTYNSPWITQYFVFDIAAVTNSSLSQLFDGSGMNTVSFGSPQAAYNDAVANGYFNKIRVDPINGREGTVFTTSYTVATATTLVFAIPDNGLSDNGGGVSVVVRPVPEPGTTALLAAAGGLLMAGSLARARRRRLA